MHGLGSALKKGKMQTWAYTPLFQQKHVPIVEAVLHLTWHAADITRNAKNGPDGSKAALSIAV
jgi:hypothetical protein